MTSIDLILKNHKMFVLKIWNWIEIQSHVRLAKAIFVKATDSFRSSCWRISVLQMNIEHVNIDPYPCIVTQNKSLVTISKYLQTVNNATKWKHISRKCNTLITAWSVACQYIKRINHLIRKDHSFIYFDVNFS